MRYAPTVAVRAACHFRKGLWLTDVQPDDECRVAYCQAEAEHANRPILHHYEHVTGRRFSTAVFDRRQSAVGALRHRLRRQRMASGWRNCAGRTSARSLEADVRRACRIRGAIRAVVSLLRRARRHCFRTAAARSDSTILCSGMSTPRSRSRAATASASCSCCSIFSGAIRRAPHTACRWAGARTSSPTVETREALLDRVFVRCSSGTARSRRFSRGTSSTSLNGSQQSTAPISDAWLSDSVSLIHSSDEASGHRRIRRYALARSVSGLDLDFYQVHWYDSLNHQPALDTPVAETRVRSPCAAGRISDARIEADAGGHRRGRARGGLFRRVLLVGVGEGRVLSRVYIARPAYAGPPYAPAALGCGCVGRVRFFGPAAIPSLPVLLLPSACRRATPQYSKQWTP